MFNLTSPSKNILVAAASLSGCILILILRSIADGIISNAAYFSTRLTFLPSRILATAASLSGCIVILRSITKDLVPSAVRAYFSTRLTELSNRFSSHTTVLIEELDGITPNDLFSAANTYLGSKVSISPTCRFKVSHIGKDNKELLISMDRSSNITDHHDNVEFKWLLVCTLMNAGGGNAKLSESRRFELSFHKKHQKMVLTGYLPRILREAKVIREQNKAVKLYAVHTNNYGHWTSIALNHPATMETVVMEENAKKASIEDLERFIKGKEYYRRVGRAWKRGYLLYGPPGTGKSSLVAAIANHLNYSIYDMDLKLVQNNSCLRSLMVSTESRSILVIFDCSIELNNRMSQNTKITLSALLNFIDGLWSSCGEERIIIFTTNHKERLDPALLRPGRMDVHINMSYCTFGGFKMLANNYLGVQSHPMFIDIKEALKEAPATPAEVVGELMKSTDANVALAGLLQFLQANLSKKKRSCSKPKQPLGT